MLGGLGEVSFGGKGGGREEGGGGGTYLLSWRGIWRGL